MSSWIKSTLAPECSIAIGGTPARNRPDYWDADRQTSNHWVAISDLRGRFVTSTAERISHEGVRNSSAKLVGRGSVLLSFKLSLGRTAIAGTDLYTNEAIAALRSETLDHLFLYYGLQSWDLLADIDQAIKGATLNKAKLKRIPITFPRERNVQLKIAEVLDAIDRAIEQTEALLAKQQRIKTGLMHDLLTRGLDDQGRLRDPSTSTFKPSRVGSIPTGWKPSTVGAECDQVCVGIVIRPTQYYAEQGPIALRSLNVQSGFFDLSNVVRIRQEANETLSKSRLKAGDVVTVRTGEPGTSAVVTPELEGANCIDLVISRPGRRLRSGFLALWMNSAFGKGHVFQNQGGLAQQHFNVGDMKLLPIPLPDPAEQDAIIARGVAITKNYDELQETYTKLRRLKRGLMDDLLTGRVPVAPLLANPQAPVSS